LDQVHRIARFTEAILDPSLAAAGLAVAAVWHRAESSQPSVWRCSEAEIVPAKTSDPFRVG